MTPSARNLLDLLNPVRASTVRARVPPLPRHDWEEVASLAVAHGVAPLLHRNMQAQGMLAALPDDIRARLEQERQATALANLGHCAAFRSIADAFAEKGIALMALKGLHLAELAYRDVSLRPMGDVDILVHPHDIKAAMAALQRIGYGPEEDMADAAVAMHDIGHAVALAHRQSDMLIELHWNLSEPGYGYAVSMDEIWSAAAHARLADAQTLVMSPEFLLLHVCAHLACNHTFLLGLRGLCDIAEIVRAQPRLNWDAVIAQGQRHGWQRGVAAALRLAHDHLGAAVPAEVLERLGAQALDGTMFSEAIEHLLASHEMPEQLNTAPNFLAFAEQRSLSKKLALAWKRIFMPRAELALKYGVSPRSPSMAFHYVLRLYDLARQYAAFAWKNRASNSDFRRAAARHARLATWFAGKRNN